MSFGLRSDPKRGRAFRGGWFGLYNWGERDVDVGTAAVLVNIGPILRALLGD